MFILMLELVLSFSTWAQIAPNTASWAHFNFMDNNFYLSGLNVQNRECWVVGHDEEAFKKTEQLARTGARVTLVASQLDPSIIQQLNRWGVLWLKKEFEVSDLKEQFFVLYCLKTNPELTKAVYRQCRKKRILLCALDQPNYCDVVNVSVFEKRTFKNWRVHRRSVTSRGQKNSLGVRGKFKRRTDRRFFPKA